MVSPILFSKHPISHTEVDEMNEKVFSITDRIRVVEKRLMGKGFIEGLAHWNSLLELQAIFMVRQTPNDGDYGGWYVVLPTKECIDILNKLSRTESQKESNYLLLQISKEPSV